MLGVNISIYYFFPLSILIQQLYISQHMMNLYDLNSELAFLVRW